MLQLLSKRGSSQYILPLLIIIVSRRRGYGQVTCLAVLLRNKFNRPIFCFFRLLEGPAVDVSIFEDA